MNDKDKNPIRSFIARYLTEGVHLRWILVFVISLLIVLQSFAFSIYSNYINKEKYLQNTMSSMESMLTSSSMLMDFRLNSLLDRVIVFTTDSDVYDLISSPIRSSYAKLQQISTLEQKVQRYFIEYDTLSMAVIVSPHMSTSFFEYSFPSYDTLLALDGFQPQARYPYTQWLCGNDLKMPLQNRHGLLVRQLNLTKYENDTIIPLPRTIEPHYLIIALNQELYTSTLGNSLLYDDAHFGVFTPSGALVASSDNNLFSSYCHQPMEMDGASVIRSGYKELLLCQTTSSVTGWKIIVGVPTATLMGSISMDSAYLLLFLLFLTVSAITMASLIIGVLMRPMKTLVTGVAEIGRGNFDTTISIERSGDFRLLSDAINKMTMNLKRLIAENFEIHLQEQSARITALEMQINPHLVYNTLNTIVYMIEAGNRECAAKMVTSLSSLLQYASNRHLTEITFQEDMEWIKHYLYIMSIRFPRKYTVYYHIDPEMYACYIPKLILQPLLENCILHGLSEKTFGGVIDIRAVKRGDTACFSIQDNGKGIPHNKQECILNHESTHIGCKNVHNRIKLLYGEGYGIEVSSEVGEYTKMTVFVPYHTSPQ